MKLEEEIKQPVFKNELQKLAINVIYTGNWINMVSVRVLKPYNMSPQQYNILRILRGQHPETCTLGLVQSRMLDRMSNGSRLIDKLFENGLVIRELDINDRRKVKLLITQAGLDILSQLDELMEKKYEDLTNISLEDAKIANDIIDKLRN